MRTPSITRKIMLLSAGTLGTVVLLLVFYLLPSMEEALFRSKVESSRNLAQMVEHLLGHYHRMELEGELTRDEALSLALETVSALRFGDDNYFWLNDLSGVVRMHPMQPELVGQSLVGRKDPSGKPFFDEMLEKVRARGEGFVSYLWPRPGSEATVPKISYVLLFEPWEMVIGGGVYTDDVQREVDALRNRILAALAVGLALLLTLDWLIARRITRPVLRATRAAQTLARGDLSVRLESGGGDEAGRLLEAMRVMIAHQKDMAEKAERIAAGDLTVEVTPSSERDTLGLALARMIDTLREQIQEIAATGSLLSTSSSEISTSVEQLAVSATQTATSSTQTMATMEELRQAVELAASKAGMVTDRAGRSKEAAGQGENAARSAARAMERIVSTMESVSGLIREMEEKARTAQEIVETVDDLADESNLLAVNAAIEAARADQGAEGFGVVAREIRHLADLSKEATVRVRRILNELALSAGQSGEAVRKVEGEVDEGERQSGLMESVLAELARSVEASADAAMQIAASSRQQDAGLEQVLLAMRGVNEASMQNASTSRQLAEEAHRLKELGDNLRELIGRYRMD